MTPLQQALLAFEPFELRPEQPERFYIPSRRTYRGPAFDPLLNIERHLDRYARGPAPQARPPKLLLSGHRGTGKSTELRHLAARLGDRFEIILCSTSQLLAESDFDARDLLLVLAHQVAQRVEKYDGLAALDQDAEAQAALRWLKGGLADRVPLHLEDKAVSFSLLGVLSGRLRLEGRTRAELRRLAESQPADLRALLNRPLVHLEGLVGRKPLLILDDLEKYPPEAEGRDRVFSTDLALLLSPEAPMVLTVPVDVRYDPRFAAVQNHQPRPLMLGHIKLWEDRGQTPFAPGWQVLRDFVAARAPLELFEPAALERAIAQSGGSFDQLRRLLHRALDLADAQGDPQVNTAHLAHAERELRADYVRSVGAHMHTRQLQRIHAERRIQPPEDLRYLATLAVMEHENDNPWYDVNPVFLDFVLESPT